MYPEAYVAAMNSGWHYTFCIMGQWVYIYSKLKSLERRRSESKL